MTLPQPSALTDQQVVELQGELERRLRRIERSAGTSVDGNGREIDQSTVGRLSRIEALQNQGFTESLKERERTQRDEVVQALGRIVDGSFGLCSGCHAPIHIERLLIFPEARTCSGCLGVH